MGKTVYLDSTLEFFKVLFFSIKNLVSKCLVLSSAFENFQISPIDLRMIPSVVGGDELSRHGIVLAKSMPVKPFKIQTGEPLRDTFAKCPHLVSVSPDYHLYMKASNAMVEIIREYSPNVYRFRIDECL